MLATLDFSNRKFEVSFDIHDDGIILKNVTTLTDSW